jgi:tetratricopeptide (TPR) repeat protein
MAQYADRLAVERRAELMDAYSDECSLIGEESDAKLIQQEALKLWHAAGVHEKEGRALRRLAEICFEQRLGDEMSNYISQAITLLESLQPTKELAMAYSHKSRQHVVAEQYADAIYWGMRAKEYAEARGDLETLAHVQSNLGIEEMRFGRHAEDGHCWSKVATVLSNNFHFMP